MQSIVKTITSPEILFDFMKQSFQELIDKNNLQLEEITLYAKALTPDEAIGKTERQDYPILIGKEVMVEAAFKGFKGQAFTDSPAAFAGNLLDIMAIDLHNDSHGRGIFIAALNAVMAYLKLTANTIHCKNHEPEDCAREFIPYLQEHYQSKQEATLKITQIGYQPGILGQISDKFQVRILDLNPDNMGQMKSGVIVEDGITAYEDGVKWADLILCTGSTLCNGTLVNFLNLDKNVLFYGTTLAGVASLLELPRACFCSK